MFSQPMRGALVCLFAAALPCGAAFAQSGGRAPTPVVVAEIVEAPFADEVEALGTLRANEAVDVTSKVTDRIIALHFDDGDRVSDGQLLAELDSAEERAMLDEARAARDEAAEQLARFEALEARRAATESDLSVRRREYQVAEARVRAMEARVADRSIRAPFAGRVGLRTISVGATVEPGDPIARLIDDAVMKLDFSVPTVFLSALHPGVKIVATSRAWPGEPFEGVVRSIDAAVDPVTRSVVVRATLPNDDGRLVPGLLMEVTLTVDERMALTAPEEALIPLGPDAFVLLVVERDGALVAERRQVQVGAREVGRVEILDGLSVGDRVVTHGAIKIRPGQPIEPRDSPIAAAAQPDADPDVAIE